VEALWSRQVEGDAFRALVVEADRVLVSTGKQTLVVSREGDVLDRHEPPLLRRAGERWSVPLGEHRYTLGDAALLTLDASGREIGGARLPLDLVERYRERFVAGLPEKMRAAGEEALHRLMRDWWWRTALVPDPDRGRLLAVSLTVPWFAKLRADGVIEWLLYLGAPWDCCNQLDVIASDGTLAHFSSCGRRLTFATTAGQITSVHPLDGEFGSACANGRGVVYLVDPDRIVAYRAETGPTNSLEVPHIRRAECSDGILYAVIDHPSDGIVLLAFREPT
jgi:hypothetical protein